MRECSLAGGCGAGDEINFSSTSFEVYAHQNGGRAIAGINIREANQHATLE